MSDELRRLLGLQQKRLLAAVLGFAEREIYPDLTAEQRKAFRSSVIDAVGSYHGMMLDIVGSQDPNTLVNAEAIEMLREIREQVMAMRGDD